MGFGPQLVDFDSDGRDDVVSGDWPGHVVLFRRKADGTFAAGEQLADRKGKTIKVDYGATVFTVDWDADGDLDMLIGTVDGTGEGNVYLIRNEGSRERYALAEPEKLHANGQEIVAPEGDAAPVAADWDGDGKLDLLLGAGDGSVHWYRNIGSPKAPKFAARQTLILAPAEDSERGIRAKICVTDWNDDGVLDIVLGDFGDEFEKELSDEEKQWREKARQQQADLLKSWGAIFQKYRKLLREPKPRQDTEQRKQEVELASLRKELVQLKRVRDKNYREEQALKPGTQYHGRVWLYLRRNPNQEP